MSGLFSHGVEGEVGLSLAMGGWLIGRLCDPELLKS